jgi:hypothetical protein
MKPILFLLVLSCLSRHRAAAQTDKVVYAFVGERQKACGADSNTLTCDSARKSYLEKYDSTAKADFDSADYKGLYPGDLKCPQTGYESLAQRKKCDFLQASANTILMKYKVDTTNVFFSLIPDNCFNAMTTPMGDFQTELAGKWLVEFNVGFTIYCYKLSILCANMVPLSGDEDSLDLDPNHYYAHLKDPNSYQLYLSLGAFLLADLCGEPNIQSDSILLRKSRQKFVAGALSDGINTFVLCHELAHIILNHAGEIHQLGGTSAASVLAVVKYKREAEFQADSLGLILFKEVEEKNKNYIGRKEYKTVEAPFRYAPLVFFTWLDIIQQFELRFTNHFRGMETYPTAAERREKLLKVYTNLALYDESALNFADLLDGSIRLTYDVIKPMYDSNDESIKALANRPSNYCPIR